MKKKDLEAGKIAIATVIENGESKQLDSLFNEYPELLHDQTGVGTWLHYSAGRGNLPAIQFFLSRGIDINSPMSPSGCPPETAIFDAVMHGSVEVVEWLLQHGIKSNCIATLEGGVERNFALNTAITNGRLDLVKLLVEYGANVNICYANRVPLSLAEALGHKEIAKFLRKHGALTLEQIQAQQKKTKTKRKK
jgi:ankyrin repeat protein